jgi:hypothetical protein
MRIRQLPDSLHGQHPRTPANNRAVLIRFTPDCLQCLRRKDLASPSPAHLPHLRSLLCAHSDQQCRLALHPSARIRLLCPGPDAGALRERRIRDLHCSPEVPHMHHDYAHHHGSCLPSPNWDSLHASSLHRWSSRNQHRALIRLRRSTASHSDAPLSFISSLLTTASLL